MENITIGQTVDFVILIASLIGAVGTILIAVKKVIQTQFEPIRKEIKALDVSQCKNFLVRFLADVEHGEELDVAEMERACDIYDHYKDDLKQNSYIHRRWSELMENNKD